MARDDLEDLGKTIEKLVNPKIKPRELLKAVRERHPKASTKEIVRAAFYQLIVTSQTDVEKARELQNFALTERTEE